MFRNYMKILIYLMIGLFWSSNGLSATPPAPVTAQTPASRGVLGIKVNLKDVRDFPEKHLNKKIVVTGTLRYTTDKQFLLEDANGNTVAVIPWAPPERMFSPPGIEDTGPKLIWEYVDKAVTVSGQLTPHTGRYPNVKSKYYIEVDSAQEK